jgi:hypothetical protein
MKMGSVEEDIVVLTQEILDLKRMAQTTEALLSALQSTLQKDVKLILLRLLTLQK